MMTAREFVDATNDMDDAQMVAAVEARDREVATKALRDAGTKIDQWFSIASRAPSFDSWAALRRSIADMADRAERGES